MASLLQLLAPFAWPSAALLFFAFCVWWLCSDLRPIVSAIISGLATHAQRQAPAYGLAMLLGSAGSLQALEEVAEHLNWIYVAAAAKVSQPFVVAVIGFIMKGPAGNPPSGTTNPPFQKQP